MATRRDANRTAQAIWRRRGPAAIALLPLAWIYGAIVWCRQRALALGWLSRESLPVPVVVVGNLVAGGAGKTPTVIAIVDVLRRHGRVPGVISRGYGRRDEHTTLDVTAQTSARDSGDEPLLIRRRTGVPVVVARRRADAARALLRSHPGVDVIVSDDGLQHLSLPRQLQVVVFDERGAGNGWLLPAGPLRERMRAAPPPRTLILYNAPAPSTSWQGMCATRSLAGFTSLAEWTAGAPASMSPLADLKTRGPVLAAAGMARPQRFFGMLRACGLDIVECALPDHHDFAQLPWPASTRDVIVTEKDAVKLDPSQQGATRVWVATLDFRLPPEFEKAFLDLLPAPAGL